MRQDADIISELGCTGMRFVHYPHSKFDVQQYDEPATFLRHLHEKAKQLDPQRLTTLAICYDQD